MINYIIQVVLFQVLFLAVYDLFLNKETFFQKNRAYLLATPILSFLLPLIKIPSFKTTSVATEAIIYLPEIVISPQRVIEKTSWYASLTSLELIFFSGVLSFFSLFLIKLLKIVRLIKQNDIQKREVFKLVFLPNKTKAFSFFNYIFLGKNISKNNQEQIILHEMVHSKQKHSLDLLVFEILKIVMWFNPMWYFYQKRIAALHEYIADDFATKTHAKEHYIDSLLSEAFAVENISFINQFYKNSFLKKRIMMMTKQKSKQIKQLKYLVLIPVLASMLFYSACSDSEIIDEQVEIKKQRLTLYTSANGKIKAHRTFSDKSFLDMYIGAVEPNWKEIEINDLSPEEQDEFKLYRNKTLDNSSSFEEINFFKFKLYRSENGRNVIATFFDSPVKKKSNGIEEILERKKSKNGSVSFMTIEKTPTFPGCDTGDKDCFSKMVQKHFVRNFDSKLPNTLGLESGRKRVFIQMTIDTNGHVVDINTRTPHEEISKEVKRVMNLLPKMIPGEDKGKKVAVKYSIPFTLVVE